MRIRTDAGLGSQGAASSESAAAGWHRGRDLVLASCPCVCGSDRFDLRIRLGGYMGQGARAGDPLFLSSLYTMLYTYTRYEIFTGYSRTLHVTSVRGSLCGLRTPHHAGGRRRWRWRRRRHRTCVHRRARWRAPPRGTQRRTRHRRMTTVSSTSSFRRRRRRRGARPPAARLLGRQPSSRRPRLHIRRRLRRAARCIGAFAAAPAQHARTQRHRSVLRARAGPTPRLGSRTERSTRGERVHLLSSLGTFVIRIRIHRETKGRDPGSPALGTWAHM